MQESGKKTKEMTFDELKKNAADLKKSGIDASPVERRLHKRIAESFSSFAFVLIGIPLAITTRRSEKSIGFGISLALIVVYWPPFGARPGVRDKGRPPYLARDVVRQYRHNVHRPGNDVHNSEEIKCAFYTGIFLNIS